MDIKGKRVLITGGPSGIGFALVTVPGHKGAQVVTTGRAEALDDAAAKLRHAGIACSPVVADVSTEDGRAATIIGALEALDGIDIPVNNAGAVHAAKLATIPEADIRRMIDVDLVAPMLLTRSALPHLPERPGALVHTSRAGPELGFTRECEAAEAIAAGIDNDAWGVIGGGEARSRMMALNRDDPAALDARFADIREALAEVVRDHTAL